MGIKIVADSGCDVSKQVKQSLSLHKVPLTINIGEQTLKDDDNLVIEEFLAMMRTSKDAPTTGAPSPGEFLQVYDGEDDVFVVTLSSKISGTYNSALLAKKILQEKTNNKFIHVFDSLSASVGETLVCKKIRELADLSLPSAQIVERVNKYIQETKTFFLLDNLDNLIKSGRVNHLAGRLAALLSIKPIMGSTPDGDIQLIEKVRGSKRSLRRFVDLIGEQGTHLETKVLAIAHCNCLQKARELKEHIVSRYNFKEILIVPMGGVISIYANEGGLLIAF